MGQGVAEINEEVQKASSFLKDLVHEIEKVIVGQKYLIDRLLVGLLANGHVLLEGVPGLAKTLSVKTLSQAISTKFQRLQFTPDLLPSDVTGVSVFNQKTREFEFRPGPVIAQIVLTDEINRATPKTQSALLEAMEERQITVDGVTYRMPRPFLVLATQNPIEYEGTFPLPEAQLDRFMMRIRLGYPNAADEIAILDSQQFRHPVEEIGQAISVEELLDSQEEIKQVHVGPLVKEYIVGLVNASRSHPDVYLGSSPRGSLYLYRTAQAMAAVEGRDYVIPDDVKALAETVLAHRLIVSPSARIKNVDTRGVVTELLESVPVPGTRVRV